MFKTLYGKLVGVLIGFSFVMVVTFLVVVRYSHENFHQEISQKLNQDLAAKLIQEKQTMLEGQRFNPIALKNILDRLALINPGISLYLLDEKGLVLASSASQGSLKRNNVNLTPIRQFLTGASQFPVLGDNPADPLHQQVFSVASVSFEGFPEGYLYVILRGEERDSLALQLKQSYTLRESLWLLGTAVMLSLIASILLVRLITHPLRRLTKTVERFRDAGFSEQAEDNIVNHLSGNDDINRLVVSFNEMMRKILCQMQELRQTDAARREMIANISHDLRTPLAALNGYLETLHLKRSTLTESERSEYFEIAFKQSAQLSRLVTKLFELAKLDANAAEFFSEPFPMDDLVQDVAEKFSLAAGKKGVDLEVNLPETLPLVYGDIGLIERVLENLIDNAVRYTSTGGKVRVNVSPADEEMIVEVTDTGCGIEANELPWIFDRFYRGEKSRHAGESAGLGLAITKRILELHGSTIKVESALGRGTRFWFHLPLASPNTRSIVETLVLARPVRKNCPRMN